MGGRYHRAKIQEIPVRKLIPALDAHGLFRFTPGPSSFHKVSNFSSDDLIRTERGWRRLRSWTGTWHGKQDDITIVVAQVLPADVAPRHHVGGTSIYGPDMVKRKLSLSGSDVEDIEHLRASRHVTLSQTAHASLDSVK